MTEFRKDYINGRSEKISIYSKPTDHFDLFIFFSPDIGSKFIEIATNFFNNLSFTYSVLISLRSIEINSSSTESNNSLNHFFKTKVEENKFFHLEYDTFNLDELVENIVFIIEKVVIEKKKPLNVGFNMNNCPNYLIIYILKLFIKNYLSANISFFYYTNYETCFRNFCSSDSWKLVDMSDHAKGYDIEKSRVYFISLGHDRINYSNILDEYDSGELKILLPESNLNSSLNLNKLSKELNFLYDYNISEENMIFASEDDAIDTWEKLVNLSANEESYSQIFVVSGLKPHALAIGICGLLNGNIIIAYLNDEPSTLKIDSVFTFWRYDIEDLSLIL